MFAQVFADEMIDPCIDFNTFNILGMLYDTFFGDQSAMRARATLLGEPVAPVLAPTCLDNQQLEFRAVEP